MSYAQELEGQKIPEIIKAVSDEIELADSEVKAETKQVVDSSETIDKQQSLKEAIPSTDSLKEQANTDVEKLIQNESLENKTEQLPAISNDSSAGEAEKAEAEVKNDLLDNLENEAAQEAVSDNADVPSTEKATERSLNLSGQGVINGEIFDKESGKGLLGVIVEIAELKKSARTDAKGRFQISGLTKGDFKLLVTKAGYITETQDVTLISESVAMPFSLGLRERPTDSASSEFLLEEYEVVAEFVEESDKASLLLGSANGPSFTSGIGAAEFSKVGVSDVAGALSKVSGASIVDGKYVVVRGLADRYVTTTLNGLPIISADSTRKAVQLDLLPTFMVNQINVDKTYRATKQGDFGGGSVDVLTKFIPDERKIKVEYGISTFEDNPSEVLAHSANSQGFTDGGEFTQAPDNAFVNPRDEFDNLLRQQSFVPRTRNGRPNQDFKLQYEDVYDLTQFNPSGDELKIGWTLGYQREYRELFTQEFFQLWTEDNVDPNIRSNRDQFDSTFTEAKYAAASITGGLLPEFKVGPYNVDDESTVSFAFFDTVSIRDRVFDERFEIQNVSDSINFHGELTPSPLGELFTGEGNGEAVFRVEGRQRDLETLVREVEIQQVLGQHKLTFSNEDGKRHQLGLNWGRSNTLANENQPFTSSVVSSFLNPDTGVDPEPQAFEQFSNGLGNIVPLLIQFDLVEDREISSFASREELRDFIEASFPALEAQFGVGALNSVQNDLETSFNNSELVFQQFNPDLEPAETFELGPLLGGVVANRSRIQRIEVEHELESSNFGLDYTFFANEESEIKLSLGDSRVTQVRNSSGGEILFFPGGQESSGGLSGNQEALIDAVNDAQVLIDNGFAQQVGDQIVLSNRQIQNYLGEADLAARYIQLDFDLNNHQLGFGLRRETEERGFRAIDRFLLNFSRQAFTDLQPLADDNLENFRPETQDVIVTNDLGEEILLSNAGIARDFNNEYVLPSAYYTVALNEDRLRAGFYWSQTVARPTFFEFVPVNIADSRGFISQGQVTSDTEILNLDFTLSYDVNDSLTLGGAAFYKFLDKPIYALIEDSTGNLFYRNGDEATLSGFELEGDLQITDRLSFKTNYTFITGEFLYTPALAGDLDEQLSSTLAEQPSHIFNGILSYDYQGLKANLIYNFTGEYASALRSVAGGPQINRNAFEQWDFNISKTWEFDNMDFTLKFAVNNLFAEIEEFVIDSENFSSADGQISNSSTRGGRFYSIGASLEF